MKMKTNGKELLGLAFLLPGLVVLTVQAGPEQSALASATPVEAVAPREPTQWSVAGEWQVTHPNWTGTLLIRPDGTFMRPHGDGGQWSLAAEGDHLVLTLAWKSWADERATMTTADLFTGQVRKGQFTLRRGGETKVAEAATAAKKVATPEFHDPAQQQWLSGSIWQFPDGRQFTLHPDGTTTGDWHDRKGHWRLIDRDKVEMTYTWRELPPATVTVDHETSALRWNDEGVGRMVKRVDDPPATL